MSESKKKKTGIEKLKEEKKDIEEELAEAMNKGAIVEDIAPCLKYCSDQEFYHLMDEIFSLPQVQGLIIDRQENEQEEQDG